MDDESKAEPKLALSIALFIGVILVIADLIDLIPFAGDIVDLVIGAPLQIFLFMIGVRGVFVLISNVIELIPFLQEFPTRTIAWVATVIVDRNPNLEAATSLVGAGLEGGEGILEIADQGEAFADAATAAGGAAEAGESIESVQTGANLEEGQALEPSPAEGDEDAAAKARRDEEIEEALGEQPTPQEALKRDLFAQISNNVSRDDAEEDAVHEEKEGVDNPQDVPLPPKQRQVFDISRGKTDAMQDRWQRERRSDDDDPSLPLAA